MRTKGATSCVAIKLSKLNKVFGPQTKIFVSRQQMDAMGIKGDAVVRLRNRAIIQPKK